ncbi:unnamed protein product, partial [Protopolystoma xenopodis]
YFARFLFEAPLITQSAIGVLRRYCWVSSQAPYGFQVAMKEKSTLFTTLPTRHERVDKFDCSGVYCVSCGAYDQKYIGETGRKISTPIKEHQGLCRKMDTERPELAEHTAQSGHEIIWNATEPHTLLHHLIELRPIGQRCDLLSLLLNFTSVEPAEIRNAAIAATKDLAGLGLPWRQRVENYATDQLYHLLLPRPPLDLFAFRATSATSTFSTSAGPGTGVGSAGAAAARLAATVGNEWTEGACLACLYLYLALIPENPGLLNT